MLPKNEFDKSNIDEVLKEVAKKYRKLTGKKHKAEIILIGGASILVNYGFRNNTYDVDALLSSSYALDDAINYVRDLYHLPNGWLNDDFKQTDSYSDKIVQYSTYYRTFSNILEVRTITGEYLIAMKLKSFRSYKNDRSDIVGIIADMQQNKDMINFEIVQNAYKNLYNEDISEEKTIFIKSILETENLKEIYESTRQNEMNNKNTLVAFEENYDNVLTQDNLEDILAALNKRINDDYNK